MADTPRASREPLLFAAACVAVALAFQGTRGLWETDEGRYAECAREMLASGDWLLPTLQGHPHLTKPPGTYWLVAAGLGLLGRGEWGARLALGLALAASAACVRAIGRSVFARAGLGEAAGARAGWIYLGMLYPFAAGSALTTDAFLAAFVLAGFACALRASASPRAWAWDLLAGLATAAAVFVKGTAALVPWAAWLVGRAWAARAEGGRRPFRASAAVAVGVALVGGLAWYGWASLRVPGAWEHFTGHELKGRLTTAGDHSEKGWLYYLWVLPLGALPWWVPAVRGARRLRLGPPGRLLAAWCGITLLVFLVLPGKMPLYLLPCAAPIALWAAAGARDGSSPFPVRPLLLAAWLGVLCLLRLGAAHLADLGRVPGVPDRVAQDVAAAVGERDMRALAAAVERADAGRGLVVALLAGKDAQGLDFHRAGRVRRLATPQIPTDHAVNTLGREARERAERGETWLLVAEDDVEERRAVARVGGSSAREVAAVPGWKVFEMTPPPR